MVAGVEKILGDLSRRLKSQMAGHVIPSTDNLVHNQRDGSHKSDLSALEDIGFDDFERLVLITRVEGGDSCPYA